jgi:hypothetical protein
MSRSDREIRVDISKFVLSGEAYAAMSRLAADVPVLLTRAQEAEDEIARLRSALAAFMARNDELLALLDTAKAGD